MKKFIIDSSTKTAFSINNKIYKQIDGVSNGSPVGPFLVNIIITELKKVIVQDLVDKHLIKVYMRYVDDTLLLVKEKDIKLIHERLNSFDKNIKFTVDNFPDGNVHFLDIQIYKNHKSISYQPTHTIRYTRFRSHTPWPIKIAWVKVLFHRDKRVYSTNNIYSMDKLKRSKNLCPGIHTLN